MARGLNTVYLAGTVTEKPELAYTQGGLAILKVNVAGSDHILGDDGQARELAWYHRVTLFGAQAEAVVNQLQASTPVLVEGRLQHNRWQTPDGQNRSTIDIIANRIDPMTFGGRNENDATIIDARGQHRLRDAFNQVLVVGNLTRDAEYRETPNGIPLVRFSIAVNERIYKRGGSADFEERVHFFDATAWRDLAIGSQNLQKGDPVFISGRLVRESWVDKEGTNRSTTRIEVQRVEHLTRGPGTGGAGTQPSGQPQAGQASTSTLDIDDEFPPEEDLPF